MTTNAVEMYRTLLSRYTPRGIRGTHEGFSVLEFQFRLLAILVNALLRADKGSYAPLLPRTAGLGEWMGYLRSSVRFLQSLDGSGAILANESVAVALSAFDQAGSRINAAGGFKGFRDYLAHGGPLPKELREGGVVDAVISEVSEAIEALLAESRLSFGSSTSGRRRPILTWDTSKAHLWPCVFLDAGVWHVFSRQPSSELASYIAYDGSSGVSQQTGEETLDALRPLLRQPKSHSPIQTFMHDVLEDLQGFAEDGSAISSGEFGDGFEVVWDKATSEGTEFRRDYFRLGLDDRREWQASDSWVSYSDYLRALVRWEMVASRLFQGLTSLEADLDSEEAVALGWSRTSPFGIREARVRVSDFAGSGEYGSSFTEMMHGVDSDLRSNRGQTQVVFLNGEAGIGKTRAMLKAALVRAQQVAEGVKGRDGSALPLYLYVRSTGQVLDNLENVVAGAVVNTRILTDQGVRALCRNGLMTILIDGFDELLGNARYGDALGSLRPWLTALGGRGVMVVSARSSYYVGQYRSSVLRAQRKDFPLVRHRIAEMQRWTSDEVLEFAARHALRVQFDRLSSEDKRLLQLPFFAQVFVDMCSKESSEPELYWFHLERLRSRNICWTSTWPGRRPRSVVATVPRSLVRRS